MRFRSFRRAVALGFALAICILCYWLERLRGQLTLERRARWLQGSARRLLASLGIRSVVEGQPAANGLVVSNHLSYLDIALFAAAMPCSFVSKIEVARWPYFGRAAQAGGTLFLDRSSHASATEVAAEMVKRLAFPVPILLFPEGTSTDGSTVLRFHSRLFHPATETAAPITPAAIRYHFEDGTPERELCWYGDDGFLSHLWRVLGIAGFSAHIRFGRPMIYQDAREAAIETHEIVVAMRTQESPTGDRRAESVELPT